METIDITWIKINQGSPLVGKSLTDTNIRASSGASVVALIRDNHLTANPKSMTIFELEDQIGVIGDKEQIEAAQQLITGMDENLEEGEIDQSQADIDSTKTP